MVKADIERLTPLAWAERKGHVGHQDPTKPWAEPAPDWRFAAADALHGWSAQAYHYQAEAAEFLISEADYDAALEAGAGYPATPPHAPAIAESCPHKAQFEIVAAVKAPLTDQVL
jgi:hypothetical protein